MSRTVEQTPTPEAAGPRVSSPGPPASKGAFVLLALASAVVLWHAWSIFGGYGALGDDASSHITTIATVASRLRSGLSWWSTDYNMGFPLMLYYQPLPHLFSGITCLVLGGPNQATLTYKLVSVALLTLQPWAVYYGARRAGASRWSAAFAGAIAPLVVNGLGFGYTVWASMKVGLFTQNWGNVFLPLAVGELAATTRGEARWGRGILATAGLAATHMFYAIALVPIVATWWAVAMLRHGLGSVPREAGGTCPSLRQYLVSTATDFAAVGAGAAALLAAWLVPLSQTQAFFGGWPFGRPSRVNGYGWELILGGQTEEGEALVGTIPDGILDGAGLPILGALALGGLLVGLQRIWLRDREREYAGVVLALTALATLGAVGRAGLGSWIDLYPMHRSVQLFRYVSLLQFGLVLAAGMTLGTVAEGIEGRWSRRWPWPLDQGVILAGGLAVLAVPLSQVRTQWIEAFYTLEASTHLHLTAYQEAMGWLAERPVDGRTYVGRKSGLAGHYHSGLVAHEARRPVAQSYGVGLHDALNFYTIEFFDPRRAGAQALAQLYDFEYILSSPSTAMTLDVTTIDENDRYRLSSLNGREGCAALYHDAGTVDGNPRELREDIRAWLNGNGPVVHATYVVDVQDPHSREALVGAPVQVDAVTTIEGVDGPPLGRVQCESFGGHVSVDVHSEEYALLLLKVGYHPFWRAEVDGEPVDVHFAYPGFLAVEVTPGAHEVDARFRWPAYTRRLLLLWLLVPALVWWGRRRRPR